MGTQVNPATGLVCTGTMYCRAWIMSEQSVTKLAMLPSFFFLWRRIWLGCYQPTTCDFCSGEALPWQGKIRRCGPSLFQVSRCYLCLTGAPSLFQNEDRSSLRCGPSLFQDVICVLLERLPSFKTKTGLHCDAARLCFKMLSVSYWSVFPLSKRRPVFTALPYVCVDLWQAPHCRIFRP